MGFGLIFIGYAAMFVMPYSIFPAFVGLFIIMRGIRRLAPYSKKFVYAYNAFFLLTLYSAFVTWLAIGLVANIPFLSSGIVSLVKIGEWVGLAVAHFFMFAGMIELARMVGIRRISDKCSRNLYFIVTYISVQIILDIIRPPMPLIFQSLNMLLWSVLIVMNSVQIFSCYMRICYEGEEDAEQPKPQQVRRYGMDD